MKDDQTDNPDYDDVAELAAKGVVAEVRTTFPAKITSYKHTNFTATVQPVLRGRRWDPVERELGDYLPKSIAKVPVLQHYTDAGGLAIRYKPGDYVWVAAGERSIAEWKQTGGDDITPGSTRRHKAADAVVLGPIRPRSSTPNPIHVSSASPTLSGNPVLLGDATALSFVALANLVTANLTAINAEFVKIAATLTPIVTAWNATQPAGGPVTAPASTPAPAYVLSWVPAPVAATKVKAK